MTDSELDRCMRLYYSSVYSVALCYCKNPGDAYDITQEVFLKLYTYSGAFNEEEHIKAWLLRCAINQSKDMLKSHWHRYSLPLEAAAESTVSNVEPFADRSSSRLAPFLKKNKQEQPYSPLSSLLRGLFRGRDSGNVRSQQRSGAVKAPPREKQAEKAIGE